MKSTNADPTHKALADELLLGTLQRAHDGQLRRGEAESCRAIMAAYETWSSASQRCELLERSGQIIALARELEARERGIPDIIERMKAGVREAVKGAITETKSTELAKTALEKKNRTTRRRAPRSR
ncbi:MAG TPA: hypothetical protein VGX91_00940 [Candidatus Cybelea sp.]|jgi:hypothetical protein|nr:hypothetical protein [Candidatus Cybelea sp.]